MRGPGERDARLLRGAIIVSLAIHGGLALVPGFRHRPRPGAGPPIEISLVVGAAEPAAETPPEAIPEVPPPLPEAGFRPGDPVPARLVDDWRPVPAAPGTAGPAGEAPGTETGEDAERYRPPRLLVGALPLSDEDWEALGIEGELEIAVRLMIGVDGRVVRMEPASPDLDPRLRNAVERSAAAMRFVPAALDGSPVTAWFTMTFVSRKGS